MLEYLHATFWIPEDRPPETDEIYDAEPPDKREPVVNLGFIEGGKGPGNVVVTLKDKRRLRAQRSRTAVNIIRDFGDHSPDQLALKRVRHGHASDTSPTRYIPREPRQPTPHQKLQILRGEVPTPLQIVSLAPEVEKARKFALHHKGQEIPLYF